MLKKEARKYYRSQRNTLTDAQRDKLDDLLLIQFQTLSLPFMDHVLSYFPIETNNEVNTHLFTDYLLFGNPGLNILYPRTHIENVSMEAILTGANTKFEENPYNIYEPVAGEIISPEKIDMIFVPMLICDMKGQRAGYGKGFYDRYLKLCRPDSIKIGLSYFEPIESLDDTNEFDVPLNICITPQEVYVF